MLPQSLEEGSYRLDVGRRINVEHDRIVEVGRHLFQTCNDFVNHLDEPTGRSVAALGLDAPLVGAQNAMRGTVSLCTAIWWNKETKSEEKTLILSLRESRTRSKVRYTRVKCHVYDVLR